MEVSIRGCANGFILSRSPKHQKCDPIESIHSTAYSAWMAAGRELFNNSISMEETLEKIILQHQERFAEIFTKIRIIEITNEDETNETTFKNEDEDTDITVTGIFS